MDKVFNRTTMLPTLDDVLPPAPPQSEAQREQAAFNAQWDSARQRQSCGPDDKVCGPNEEKTARMRADWERGLNT